MDEKKVIRKVSMAPTYLPEEQIDWIVFIEYADGTNEMTTADSEHIGSMMELIDIFARYGKFNK